MGSIYERASNQQIVPVGTTEGTSMYDYDNRTEMVRIKLTKAEKAAIMYGMEVDSNYEHTSMSAFVRKSAMDGVNEAVRMATQFKRV
jgi:hypothetical protein